MFVCMRSVSRCQHGVLPQHGEYGNQRLCSCRSLLGEGWLTGHSKKAVELTQGQGGLFPGGGCGVWRGARLACRDRDASRLVAVVLGPCWR